MALLFFASVIAHELAHALLGRRRGVPASSIVLGFIGGLAPLAIQASRPRDELAIALAGPLVSFVVGGRAAARRGARRDRRAVDGAVRGRGRGRRRAEPHPRPAQPGARDAARRRPRGAVGRLGPDERSRPREPDHGAVRADDRLDDPRRGDRGGARGLRDRGPDRDRPGLAPEHGRPDGRAAAGAGAAAARRQRVRGDGARRAVHRPEPHDRHVREPVRGPRRRDGAAGGRRRPGRGRARAQAAGPAGAPAVRQDARRTR